MAPEQTSEKISALRRLPALALACLVVAAAGYLWWSRSLGPSTIAVYIVGEVHEPGLVVLPRGSRVAHAIEAAGGLTQRADHLAINLAEKLEDEQKVLIPKRGALGADSSSAPPIDVMEGEPPTMIGGEELPPPPPVPDPSEAAALPPADLTSPGEENGGGHWEGGVVLEEEAAPTLDPGPAEVSGGGLVSVNRATVEELQTVPGIGPDLAASIVAYRQGPPPRAFSTLEDLMNVPGIKMKKLEQLKPYIDL